MKVNPEKEAAEGKRGRKLLIPVKRKDKKKKKNSLTTETVYVMGVTNSALDPLCFEGNVNLRVKL